MISLDFIERSGAGSGFVYKYEQGAWYFNGTSFTEITDADYPSKTVKGIVYLGGTYYVMTPNGAIYGSEIDDPSTWSALNVIQALSEPDPGVCLARQLNLVVAFGTYSTEFFYNAANPTGSPLLPYESAFLEVGCASANSVVAIENQIIFMAQARQRGRSIQVLDGTAPKVISTPFIDRILDNDDLSNVRAHAIKIKGHLIYLLALPSSNKTLACDLSTGKWSLWTQQRRSILSYTVSGIAWSNGVATISYTGNAIPAGSYVTITSASPSAYNAEFITKEDSSGTVTYDITSNPGTFVSATMTVYEEGYFDISGYAKGANLDLVQDSTTGVIYALSSDTYTDDVYPIKIQIRTQNLDGGTSDMKFYSRVELIGDKVSANAYLRYSNDDYQSWSNYREVVLSNKRSQLTRLGQARRRAFDIISYGETPIRLSSMDVLVDKGYN